MPTATIGVLALQGDVREHLHAVARLGLNAIGVRRPDEIGKCQALIIPGGESTTIAKLLRRWELMDPLRHAIGDGLPTLGTCAGMVLLADRILDGTSDQETLGGLDVTVRRNAFGRQVDSFEANVDFAGLGEIPAVFIRAPWVEEAGPAVAVLARVGEGPAAGRIVAVQQDHLMATSFHPEVAADDRVHRYFLGEVAGLIQGSD